MMRLSALLLVTLFSSVTCKSILGIFPFGAKSHFMVFESLMKELAGRGHNVVVVSPFPQDIPVQNYTDISVQSTKSIAVNSFSFDTLDTPLFKGFGMILGPLNEIESNGNTLDVPGVRNLLSQSVSFDVVFIEIFSDYVFLLFANKFNAPVIGFSSGYPQDWSLGPFAVPQSPSYIPSLYSGYSKAMSFCGRLWNSLLMVLSEFLYKCIFTQRTINVFEEYIGTSEVSLEDSTKNISLFLVNTHFSFHSARPYPPQVVEVGGLHLKPAKTIPQELDKWMNESRDGVVYFSFGSMLRGSTLPQDKVKAFLQVFGTLPQRVLWKWEDDAVNELPANVKIMKWLPQRDILAHPKVKVFISHGGLLGTTEAVVSGVPILGIPMYGDQPNNVAALVENQVAVHVDYNNISVASLSYALNTLLYDKSYSENAKLLSRRFLDRPQSPLETAVYWTEYVIRHRGAPHLQSAAVHLPWYQYYLLDVAAACLAALLLTLALIYYVIRFCLRLIILTKSTKLKTN